MKRRVLVSFFNCYLPTDKGETSEIDLMMLYASGVFVFESKNYSGWIFGSEDGKNWTQSLPEGKKNRKEHFYNPIKQNQTHIKWLKKQIGEETMCHSIIVFSERCTLKKIELVSDVVKVIKRDRVKATVKDITEKSGDVLSNDEIQKIYEKLYPYTQASDEIKAMHIEDIDKKKNNMC